MNYRLPSARRITVSTLLVGSLFAACFYFWPTEKSVVFELPAHDNSLVVPVMIAGEPRLFEIDSGTADNVFHTSLRHLLGEPEPFFTEGRAADGKRFGIEIFSPIELQIGNVVLDLPEPPASCCDMTHVQESSGRNIEGLVGMPLFRSRIVRLDFDDRKLEILPVWCEPNPEWGQPIKLLTTSLRADIEVEIGEGEKTRCLIDTGFTGSIALPRDIFSRLSKSGAITHIHEIMSTSLAGPRNSHLGRLSKIKVGNFESRDLYVDGGTIHCLIGLSYFRRYRVTFDFPHSRLYLAQGKTFDVPDSPDLVGLGLLKRKGRNLVYWVRKDSAAEEAGVEVDDELITIGDNSVANMSLADVRWTLSSNGEFWPRHPIDYSAFGKRSNRYA